MNIEKLTVPCYNVWEGKSFRQELLRHKLLTSFLSTMTIC